MFTKVEEEAEEEEETEEEEEEVFPPREKASTPSRMRCFCCMIREYV